METIVKTTDDQFDGIIHSIAKLTLKVAELERQIAELTELSKPKNISVKLSDKDLRESVSSYKSDELSREAVIKRARADVVELSNYEGTGYARRPGVGHLTVEFVVDRKKRTVVALLRFAYVGTKRVRYRGIAKCNPADVFNVHIGKAIALRRALGLEVPDEYTQAPASDEKRIGDVIDWGEGPRIIVKSGQYELGISTEINSINFGRGTVIDDSRTDDEREAYGLADGGRGI